MVPVELCGATHSVCQSLPSENRYQAACGERRSARASRMLAIRTLHRANPLDGHDGAARALHETREVTRGDDSPRFGAMDALGIDGLDEVHASVIGEARRMLLAAVK